MLFKLSNLNSNLELTLGYLNPALNNSARLFKSILSENFLYSLYSIKSLQCRQKELDRICFLSLLI